MFDQTTLIEGCCPESKSPVNCTHLIISNKKLKQQRLELNFIWITIANSNSNARRNIVQQSGNRILSFYDTSYDQRFWKCICYDVGLSVRLGAFLIPFLIMIIFVGLPVFLIELSIGQYIGAGPLNIWSISPIFKGSLCAGYRPMASALNYSHCFTNH